VEEKMIDSNRYMTPREVMQKFGIASTATLYAWVRAGKLPSSIRFGRKVYFSKTSIDKAETRLIKKAEENFR
jgi:predicted DNA-binding transcriptional regulator AlpA